MQTKLIILLSSLLILLITSCVPRSTLKINNTPDNTLNNTCTISGYIIDTQTKEPLIGANIVLNLTEYKTVTDKDGYFEIKNVQPGSYRVKASYIMYDDYDKSKIKFEGNIRYSLNIELLCKYDVID